MRPLHFLAFRALLLAMLVTIVGYTVLVTASHGPDLVSVFFGDIVSLTWPGQFDVDFSCYLTLSALWVAWRHQFSGRGIALALAAQVLGILFFAPYLLVASSAVKGDIAALMLGERARGAGAWRPGHP